MGAVERAREASEPAAQLSWPAERRRLSRDLHDQVGQPLSALLIRLRWAMAQGRMAPEDLRVLEEAAQDALNATRTIASGLRPRAERIDPLEDARRYAATVLAAAGCRLSWIDRRTHTALAARSAREIASVIKESVTNVVRHARAQAVKIRLESSDGRIRITIRDDGVGLGLEQATGTNGIGLRGSAERLAELGGVFEVRRGATMGTVIRIEAPRL